MDVRSGAVATKTKGIRVKYDKPVWQLMHACADALPETFRLDDVKSWFAENYPEVGDATIRAHVVGLTEGGAKHPQFQRRSPVFRRASRGVYTPIPFEERGELPQDDPDDEAAAPIRFRLIGPPDAEPEAPDDEAETTAREGESIPDAAAVEVHEGPADPAGVPTVDSSAVDDDSVGALRPSLEDQDDTSADEAPTGTAPRGTRDKGERRRRKAAKREAKRRTGRAVERARRSLAESEEPTSTESPFVRSVPTEEPIVGARAIEAERARLVAERAKAAQKMSVAELEQARLAAQKSLDSERQRVEVEREEMARIEAERAELVRATQEHIENERARLEAERVEVERLEVERARVEAERVEAERQRAEQEAAARAEAERAAEAAAEAERVEVERLEAERARVEAERVEAERQRAEQEAAARAEAERVEAEQQRAEQEEAAARAEAERVEAERQRVEQEEAERQRVEQEEAAAHAEAQRIEAERAKAERAEAERVESARAEAERAKTVRAEAERAEAARAEAARLHAERVEAEREAEQEKKRASKLRKAARKERERAARWEREQLEHQVQRGAERTAREAADQHLWEAAQRRRVHDEDRHYATQSVRDELARLEQEALARIETERAMRDRSEAERAERDRLAFEQAEQHRRAFEESSAREQQEREELEREEQQLRLTLRPMVESSNDVTEPASEPDSSEPDFWAEQSRGHGQRETEDQGEQVDSPQPFLSPGGIVIVRAPRSDADEARASQYQVVEPTADEFFDQVDEVDDETPVVEEEAGTERPGDAIMLGSNGPRLAVPAPARDAFRDMAFQRARRDAELSGSRWFVLSAEHGLLEPQEWMSPDERAMTEIEPRHRAAWAAWVVARLETLVGELSGQVIQVEAPGSIAAPVVTALRAAGAETTAGSHDLESGVLPEPEALEDDGSVDADLHEESPGDEAPIGGEPAADDGPDAQVIPFVRSGSVPEHLADPRNAISAGSAASLPHHPGLYAWAVDDTGARDLNRALRLPVRAGVIYVGQVGGSSGLSELGFSINDHVTRVQLHGRARASTFRMTLATTLAGYLGLHTIEDPRLTQWMLEHLTIAVWPTEDLAGLQDLKTSVVEELMPALNVDRCQSTEYRERLAELSGRLA